MVSSIVSLRIDAGMARSAASEHACAMLYGSPIRRDRISCNPSRCTFESTSEEGSRTGIEARRVLRSGKCIAERDAVRPWPSLLRLRGGYRESDIVRRYVLIMTPAPEGFEEHELRQAVEVSVLLPGPRRACVRRTLPASACKSKLCPPPCANPPSYYQRAELLFEGRADQATHGEALPEVGLRMGSAAGQLGAAGEDERREEDASGFASGFAGIEGAHGVGGGHEYGAAAAGDGADPRNRVGRVVGDNAHADLVAEWGGHEGGGRQAADAQSRGTNLQDGRQARGQGARGRGESAGVTGVTRGGTPAMRDAVRARPL